jgi:hypothetical protein
MPRADATELAPKKSAPKPSHVPDPAREGFSIRIKKTKNLHFFGEAPERRPWAIQREDRPAAFCRALQMLFRRDTHRAYTGEYPIPLVADIMRSVAREFEESAGEPREKAEGKQCDSLQLRDQPNFMLLGHVTAPGYYRVQLVY